MSRTPARYPAVVATRKCHPNCNETMSPPRAVGMAERWKPWKTKKRFPTVSIAPWKSRKQREISTFPQLRRRCACCFPKKLQNKNTFVCGRWKSGNPTAGFPLSHRPDSLRRKVKTSLIEPPRRAAPRTHESGAAGVCGLAAWAAPSPESNPRATRGHADAGRRARCAVPH